jgi:hypothetical protein
MILSIAFSKKFNKQRIYNKNIETILEIKEAKNKNIEKIENF